jgi:hypothetical protein
VTAEATGVKEAGEQILKRKAAAIKEQVSFL